METNRFNSCKRLISRALLHVILSIPSISKTDAQCTYIKVTTSYTEHLQIILSNTCSAIIGLFHGDNTSNMQSSPSCDISQGSLCYTKPLGEKRKAIHQKEASSTFHLSGSSGITLKTGDPQLQRFQSCDQRSVLCWPQPQHCTGIC